MENLNWDEIKEELRKAVELNKNKDDLSIKIIIKTPYIEENQLVGSILKNEEEMRQYLSAIVNGGQPIDCDIEVNQQEKYILLRFREKKFWEKTYEFFSEMFFGDYFKKMIDAMMGAFGGMFGKEN
ncbi:MAG: hypothetical protein EU532_03940 [Promethearchaeota archaeon]|nr:MAG: hypothetical protein EU532_03940 [Candidatus Lokiarchaeota archaeon]